MTGESIYRATEGVAYNMLRLVPVTRERHAALGIHSGCSLASVSERQGVAKVSKKALNELYY
jgi:hypothetical protein